MLLIQTVPGALFWIMTWSNDVGLIWFFVNWMVFVHYLDALRYCIVFTLKVIGFFHDKPTEVTSYDGTDMTYKVSQGHSLEFWDFTMEWMLFMVTFGNYLDLASIVDNEDEEEEVVEEPVVECNPEEEECPEVEEEDEFQAEAAPADSFPTDGETFVI